MRVERHSARELAWPELVWSHFSRPRFGQFDERVAAAASAGYAGVGLYVHEYERLRAEDGGGPAGGERWPVSTGGTPGSAGW